MNVEVAICPRCKKLFTNKAYLKKHQDDEKQKWNCSQCTGMSSTSVSTYAYHMFLKHNTEGISENDLIRKYLTCQQCNSKYTQANYLCMHLRNNQKLGKAHKHDITKLHELENIIKEMSKERH